MATLYKRLRSPYWWLQWVEGGRQRRESTGVRHNDREAPPKSSPANRALLALEERLAMGRFGVPTRWKCPTLRDAVSAMDVYMNSEAKAGAISRDYASAYIADLDRITARLEAQGINTMEDVTAEQAQCYRNSRLDSVKRSTYSIERQHLSTLWDWVSGQDENCTLTNPWKKTTAKSDTESKRQITNDERKVIADALPLAPLEIQYLTLTGFYCGARLAMAARLVVDNVDFEESRIRWPRVKRREHVSYMPLPLKQFLLDYPVRDDGHFIEPSRNWSKAYCEWITGVAESLPHRHTIKTSKGEVKLLEGITHHCWRVTHNTLMAEALPEQVTMELIGHSSPAVHARYKDMELTKWHRAIEQQLQL